MLDYNFDKAVIFYSEQVSGYLNLNIFPKNNITLANTYPIINPTSIDVLFSKEENKYRFNQFWDITRNRGEFPIGSNYPPTGPLVPGTTVLAGSYDQETIWTTQYNGYIKIMGFNKKVLSKAVSELGKAKAPAKPRDIIVDPAGQWKYPGQETRIPGNDITMQGVPYPVWAQPNVGPGSMMQPNQDYNFPGASYVDETPMVKKGGTLQSKKYSKSMSATNKLFTKNKFFNILRIKLSV